MSTLLAIFCAFILPVVNGCGSAAKGNWTMNRSDAMDVSRDVEQKFETQFIVGTTTHEVVQEALEGWKLRGAVVTQSLTGTATLIDISCRYNGGENQYFLTFEWDAAGRIASKKRQLRHLGF